MGALSGLPWWVYGLIVTCVVLGAFAMAGAGPPLGGKSDEKDY